jgi:hypothetical protein
LILVDTSVLLDVITADPVWEPASRRVLDAAVSQGEAFTSSVVYAELSPGYETMEKLDAVLAAIGIKSIAPPDKAFFLAGHAFKLIAVAAAPGRTSCPTSSSARTRQRTALVC